MGWWGKKKIEPSNLGTYLDTIVDLAGLRLSQGPKASWFDDYNRRALGDKLGIRQVGPLLVPTSPLYPPTPLIFTPEMPSVFYDTEPGKPYQGNDRAKERIDYRIKAMGPTDRFKCLLVGPAGTGKTALAWIIAFRIMAHRVRLGVAPGRFFEMLPGQFENKAQLDIFMQQLQANDIVFLDEVHTLKDAVGAEPLYHTLADTGLARYPLGAGAGWINVPSGVCWIGATTEPGKLDGTTGGALRRRFEPEIHLEQPSLEDLTAIVLDQVPIVSEESAMKIADRSGGLPWQALLLYEEAKAIAKGQHKGDITDGDVDKAFSVVGVDENGLLPADRLILSTLFGVEQRMADGTVVHRMAEHALTSASGVDPSTFKERIQPKLLRLGLLTVRGGQMLTDKAVALYHHLA